MRDYLKVLCVLAAVVRAGVSLAASDADWSDCKRQDGDRARIIAACARIAGDKRSPPRERAIALNNRGNAYQTNKDFGRAIADYDAALRLDPNLAHTYLNRALALKGEGEYARALADANKALELSPAIPSRCADAATSMWRGARRPREIRRRDRRLHRGDPARSARRDRLSPPWPGL